MDLTTIAEREAHARWLVAHHVGVGLPGQRQRCSICEEWWPCDRLSLAALAVLTADRLAAAERDIEQLKAPVPESASAPDRETARDDSPTMQGE